jgi:hypothetical protein
MRPSPPGEGGGLFWKKTQIPVAAFSAIQLAAAAGYRSFKGGNAEGHSNRNSQSRPYNSRRNGVNRRRLDN